MLNENAKKWVAALRSGEYQQDKAYLRTENGLCCLGVACDLYMKLFGGQWEKGMEGFRFLGSDQVLPTDVRAWLGMRDVQGAYGPIASNKMLTIDNDQGKTFAQIADIIESEPEGLFVK
jgi:hypothetical protein